MSAQLRLFVRVGEARVGISAEDVEEIAALPARLTRVPHAPPSLLGVVQHRGAVTPVVSPAALMNTEPSSPARMLVLRGQPQIALAIDAVEALTTAPDEAPLGRRSLHVARGEDVQTFDLAQALGQTFTALRRSSEPADQERSDQATPQIQAAYLAITLAGQPYALPLSAVLAVDRPDAPLLQAPGVEAALAGLGVWRGRAIPVVSLRELLGLGSANQDARVRIIIELAGAPMALLADDVTGIVRLGTDRVAPAPRLFNRGSGEAQISEVLRPANGEGLIGVLRPETLLAQDRLRVWLSEQPRFARSAEVQDHASSELRLLAKLGAETYGVRLDAVEEIALRPARLVRIPSAPRELLGLMSLRGYALPVVDLGLQFGGESTAAGARILVVSSHGVRAGFVVDTASEIARFASDEIVSPPHLDRQRQKLFPQAAQHGEDLVLFLDPQVMLDQALASVLRNLPSKAVAP
jgi:purine-binding chemotaxis protein CheW